MAALSRWLHDTWVGVRTNPACLSVLAQALILAVVVALFGVVWAAVWLAAWHVVLGAAPFIDRLVRKDWLVGPVTPPVLIVRRAGSLGVWGYVGLHASYAVAYGVVGAWLAAHVGHVRGLDLLLRVMGER